MNPWTRAQERFISIVVYLQSLIAEKNNNNNEMLKKMRRLNDNFLILKTKLAVTKRVNTELTKRIVNLERQSWADAQYFRKEYLEVVK